MTISRNAPGPDDVRMDVLFCGVCHSDVHVGLNQLGITKWPFVGGHELAGVATHVGANVTKFKVGDRVGVGCISDACLSCSQCKKGDEQYCEPGLTGTYNSVPKYGRISTGTGHTLGGYSESITVNEKFMLKIPDGYPMEAAGPIFCAGITLYSPLVHWGARNGGKRVGIVGIGGLGQMGIRLAAAMGNEVTAISTSSNKEETAKELGATHFIVSTDPAAIKLGAGSLDLILNTVSASHQVSTYLPLLGTNGTIVQIGLVTAPHQLNQISLLLARKSVAGSDIGGIRETQEVIDFCAERNIVPTMEIITADQLDEVYTKLDSKNDSVKRHVLDIKKSIK